MDHADNLLRRGNRDSTWQAYYDVDYYRTRQSSSDGDAAMMNGFMREFGTAGYPALMQLPAYETAMTNLIAAKGDPSTKLGASYDALPDLASKAVEQFRELIHAHLSPEFLYAKDEIWTPLGKVYRAYLQHYPNSVCYRSRFAKSAAQGEHWSVAKEQFKILGDQWDRTVFGNDDYAAMSKEAAAH